MKGIANNKPTPRADTPRLGPAAANSTAVSDSVAAPAESCIPVAVAPPPAGSWGPVATAPEPDAGLITGGAGVEGGAGVGIPFSINGGSLPLGSWCTMGEAWKAKYRFRPRELGSASAVHQHPSHGT